ncbi:MAG TPA: hypothetical protein DEB40_11210 [Elusimicrobia bacterium]|nr:hypothetical protein [Elusimicrobiota bacterium]HBT62300.1 hypothetical protein [Elusimicrobiota bacterium]
MKPWLILASLALAAPPAAVRRDIGGLHDQFVESVDSAHKKEALAEIARTPPRSPRDVKWLFDLFMRFPEPSVRDAVLSSVSCLDEASSDLEPAFFEYLKLPESEAVLFGIHGALRLRASRALPIITKIARRRFAYKSPSETPIQAERNQWWAQYEALSALAQWQGAKALPLLTSQAGRAPAVARLMALYLWPESLPQIARWANSGSSKAQIAYEALAADVPLPALRAARPDMLDILRDRKADRELRHQIAIKVGRCSSDEAIPALIEEWRAGDDPETKLMFATALFASVNAQTIPWLKQQVQECPNPRTRIGALLQLGRMVPAAEHRRLIEWFVAHEPDADNRQEAAAFLKAPPSP